jgi:SAM-dependent methyltransferase
MRPIQGANQVPTDEINLWVNDEHAEWYLAKADGLPRRDEGERTLLEVVLPPLRALGRPVRLLDLGCGDGRLLALVAAELVAVGVESTGVAVDFNALMLGSARERFDGSAVEVVEHDLSQPLPELGAFDAVVSSFAIHHLVDDRKRALYGEVFDRLGPGGVFANLEHVDSPTVALHRTFITAMGEDPDNDDPSNRLVGAFEQAQWLRELGFVDADVYWKWRELALLAGLKPSS